MVLIVILTNCSVGKKEKECEREENQYHLPGFYGMNLFFEISEIDIIYVN